MRSLLTVHTSTASTGIVANLRETAAWLIALRPEATGWLADVGPVSLGAHAAIIDNPTIRHLIVERLLADPRAALAGGWQARWRLGHPGLASQLANVLSPLADPAAPTPSREQSYLALCLAVDADAGPLMPTLLAIAAGPHVDPGLRALAIDAVAQLDRNAAAPVLAQVLEEITAQPDHDPDDEVRGAVLGAAWPGQMSITELVQALTTPQRHDFLGGYVVFRGRLPGLLSDDDVPHLLRWALVGSTVPDADLDDGGSVSPPPFHDAELVRALLDRAFACQEPDSVLGPSADLIAAQMRAYHDLEVPAALDERDAEGIETSGSRARRHSLASELIAQHGQPENVGQLILWGWQPSRAATARHDDAVAHGRADYRHARRGLLDNSDLAWLLEQATAAIPADSATYLHLLRWLYDPTDLLAQETAWNVKNTLVWPAFALWFDAVAIDGDAAAQARRELELSRPRHRAWGEAPQHAARILDLYERAILEPPAFWRLLYLLQIDSVTGRGKRNLSDDIANRPGVTLLPEGWCEHLREAAWNYLHNGTPIDDEFVDNPTLTSWPAEAGYLALALLLRSNAPGRTLDNLRGDVLAEWAAAILVFPAVPASAGDAALKRRLLAGLADSAPARLPLLVGRTLDGHLRLGWRPTELALLDAAWTDTIGDVLARRLPDVSAALQDALANDPGVADPDSTAPPDLQDLEQERQRRDQRVAGLRGTIALIVGLLARYRHADGIQAALGIIVEAASPGAERATMQVGSLTATALLAADATYWPGMLDYARDAPDYARVLLQDLADDWESPALLQTLTEVRLAELWEFLTQFWPYHQDVRVSVVHFFSPDEQAQQWRDAVLNMLVQRGTSQAVQLLTDLVANHPSLPWLADRLRAAQELEIQHSWTPLQPGQLTQLLADRRSRLVRDSADLTDLVTEAIAVAAGRLTRTGQLLWNTYPRNGRESWRPKSEPDVGAWLSEQLTIDLVQSGIVINREVLVRQTSTRALGLSVDVQADAPVTSGEHDNRAAPARCRIELKGNWNSDLMNAMRTQLVMDYLLPEGLAEGIYVTAWFDVALWDESDPLRVQAATRNRESTEQELETQAESLRHLGLHIRSVIIDIPRPTASSRRQSSGTTAPKQ